jgi:hypothetical protein
MLWAPVVGGAVYKPPDVIVPVVALPPATPSTDQVTALFFNPCIVVWNCSVADGSMVEAEGEIVKTKTLTAAFAAADELATLAVIV